MSDDLRNQLLQLKKDCSQIQHTINNLKDGPDYRELNIDTVGLINNILNETETLWNDLEELVT